MAEERYVEVFSRVSQVLLKLSDFSAEVSEMESAVSELEQEARRGGMEAIEGRPDLLLVVSTLREMMNSLQAGLDRLRDVREMQVPISTVDHALEEDENVRTRCSPVVDDSSPADATKGSGSWNVMRARVLSNTDMNFAKARRPRRVVGANGDLRVCKHTCIHHPEMMDPGLWSTLLEDLVGTIFARLPIPQIIELCESSRAWSSLSNSSNFKLSFAKAQPNLFGMLVWRRSECTYWTRVFDAHLKDWRDVKLNFPFVYGRMDTWCACDGGLLCFLLVCKEDRASFTVYVCNPLRNLWKALPALQLPKKVPVLLQLVTDVDSKCYRVLLVYHDKEDKDALGVNVYDSQIGLWGTTNSSLVYGSGHMLFGGSIWEPMVFDCATKRLHFLDVHRDLEDPRVSKHSFFKDRLFAVHAPMEANMEVDTSEMFVISEYAWRRKTMELKRVNDYMGTLEGLQMRPDVGWEDMELFSSGRFILLTMVDENGDYNELIRLYDMIANEWYTLPSMVGDPATREDCFEDIFMCELHWDAVP